MFCSILINRATIKSHRVTYSILSDEGIDLFDGDDLTHQHTEPLWIKKEEVTQLRL